MLSSLKPWPKTRMALVLCSVLAIAAFAPFGFLRAQQPSSAANWEDATGDTPQALPPTDYAAFQYATLTATTNTINASYVPVVIGNTVVYKNITLQVTVDSKGNIAIVPGSPTAVTAPTNQVSSFRAGTYVGPSTQWNGKGLIQITGPGTVAGGITVWTMAAAPGTDSSLYPTSATWYVGSPTNPNHPLAARLKKAGITSTAYSYGILQNVSGRGDGNWFTSAIIGVSQVGNTITIASFTFGGNEDSNVPLEQMTFTLKQ